MDENVDPSPVSEGMGRAEDRQQGGNDSRASWLSSQDTGKDEKCMSLYLRRVSSNGLDCSGILKKEEFLPAKAPLLDFLVEDTKRSDAWKYPKLEELEKYQKFRGLNLSMLERIETCELVCGDSSASEIREVREWIEGCRR